MYFFPSDILPEAVKKPVKAEAANEQPRGIMNTKETIFTMITSAASDSTLMSPAKIARISNNHHSKQSIKAPGKPTSK